MPTFLPSMIRRARRSSRVPLSLRCAAVSTDSPLKRSTNLKQRIVAGCASVVDKVTGQLDIRRLELGQRQDLGRTDNRRIEPV
jgi:hypothetical protein